MALLLTRTVALITAALVLGTLGRTYAQHRSVEPSAMPAATEPAAKARAAAAYGNLPMRFEANQGQSAEPVKFLARGQGYGLFLTAGEAVLSLRPPAQHKSERDTVVRFRLSGANPHPTLAGLDPLPGASNYFIGSDPARWQRDVPSFAKVKYAGVYPGIDLIYYGNQRQLEYDFLVAPHADPRRIALVFDGVRKLSLDAEGNLILHTAHGQVTQHKPVIYQDVDGTRQRVDGRYLVRAKNRVGFDVDRYDTTRALVIDPVLSYSTYLGGNGNDIGHAIAVDSAGNAYVTGVTTSTNFPTSNSIQSAATGSNDVFVSKLNPTGSALVYSTYLGGSGNDIGHAIAVDSAGNAYVTGETDSGTPTATSIPFPTAAAFDASYNIGGDAFVTKLNAAGNALVYSTFLGGRGTERAYGIAVDGSGAAYVTGHTNSDNLSGGPTGGFPTVGPVQANNSSPGIYDAFVTKFNAAGSALLYSTYLGGLGNEFSLYGGGIAVDSAGNAYVGGSAGAGFPGTTGMFQATYGGGVTDGFVARLNAAGSALDWSTYLGGATYDAVHGVAVSAAGEVFVSGYTDSTNFPVAAPIRCVTPPGGTPICSQLTPMQASKGTGEDAFAARLNTTGTALVYSTFLGGNAGDRAYDVAVDREGTAYVAGWTASSDYPINSPAQSVNRGSNGDVFVSAVNECGCYLVYSTYLGGASGSETARGVALDALANAYVTGDTNSTDFPTAAPLQASRSGSIGTDLFVAKLIVPPTMVLNRRSLSFGAVTTGTAFAQNSAPQSIRITQFGANTATWTATSSAPWLVVSPASGSGSATLTISVKFAPGLTGSQTGAVNLAYTGASTAGDAVNVTLTVVSSTDAASLPFGSFDTPVGDATVLAGSIALTGWTLDNIGVKQVELWRDLQPGETTPPGNSTAGDPRNGKVFISLGNFVDNARPDVEGLYPTMPANYRAGWGYLMLTWGLFGQGNGTYRFYAFGVDLEGGIGTIGNKTVVISNNTATKPFGSIDTPGIGGEASGPNFGWGLTPRVNGAATCKIQPSGVQVSIDSGPLQPVVYGSARPDIAGAFPGFSNTSGAGGHYIFDWSTLSAGSHTIGWLITDDCNRADGVGSRFFTVTGGTNVTAEATAETTAGTTAAMTVAAELTESAEAITVAHGYGELPQIVAPGAAGSRVVEITQGGRVEIRLPRGYETAHQIAAGGQPRALPAGSTWDAASGIFYWQPAAPFLGRYRIVFSNGSERISVRVVVKP
jgi:hypothetical protein